MVGYPKSEEQARSDALALWDAHLDRLYQVSNPALGVRLRPEIASAARQWSEAWLACTESGERLTAAIQRNPRGWETWLAIQSDVAAERVREAFDLDVWTRRAQGQRW